MDLTEKILKLVSLGWDGKEELEVFFKEKYHLTYTHTSDYYDGGSDKFNIISIKYEDNTGDIHCLKVFDLRDTKDIIGCYLRLFKTVNGILFGPSSDYWDEGQEWT